VSYLDAGAQVSAGPPLELGGGWLVQAVRAMASSSARRVNGTTPSIAAMWALGYHHLLIGLATGNENGTVIGAESHHPQNVSLNDIDWCDAELASRTPDDLKALLKRHRLSRRF
jgi:hypothetical protein